MVTIFFSSSANLTNNMIIGVIIIGISIIFWVLCYRNREKTVFGSISFFAVLINAQKT
jgi:hypothetical protein